MLRSFLQHTVITILPTLLLLGMVELGFRLWGPNQDDLLLPVYIESDPDLVWRLQRREKSAYATNESGFRDDPFRNDADLKILLLGDSVSWGDGVLHRNKLFASLLEGNLSSALGGRSVEVMNTGVPGYSTFQQLALLKRDGLKLQPDIVLLQFCLNDVFERYHTVAAYGGSPYFKGVDTRTTWRGLFGVLARSSKAFGWFANLLQELSRKQEAYLAERLTQPTLSPELQEAWDLVFQELEEIHSILLEQKIPFLIYISPYRFQLEDPLKQNQPQEMVNSFATERSIPVLDALPVFAEKRGETPFWDENHYSEKGHEIAAHLLAPWIAEQSRRP